jgi:hypothetical protein
MQRIVQYEDAELELGTATYGDRLTRSALIKRFIQDSDDEDLRVARYNFIMLSSHIRRAQGVVFTPLRRAMTDVEFESGFEAFLDWPDELVQRAIGGLDEILTPNQNKATLPPEHLTEQELQEKN